MNSWLKRGAVGSLLLLSAGLAWARPSSPWSRATTPTQGPARAIGDYSAGCIAGAEALPLTGPGYQVMHPSRNRYYGHPQLVDFVETLGQGMQAHDSVLLIGDLSQPRGGRASGGHASHQSGLDVDIWYWNPKGAAESELTDGQREKLSARSVLNGKTGAIRKAWKDKVATALRLTSEDERVARMFVHPIIKRDLCESTKGDRAWLHKVRPWYGHDDHFHVRLNCPQDSPDCEPQAAIAQGDGCDELDWWFDEKAQADRRQAKKRYQRKVIRGPRWPKACDPLIADL